MNENPANLWLVLMLHILVFLSICATPRWASVDSSSFDIMFIYIYIYIYIYATLAHSLASQKGSLKVYFLYLGSKRSYVGWEKTGAATQ